jgi:hypothetical protein
LKILIIFNKVIIFKVVKSDGSDNIILNLSQKEKSLEMSHFLNRKNANFDTRMLQNLAENLNKGYYLIKVESMAQHLEEINNIENQINQSKTEFKKKIEELQVDDKARKVFTIYNESFENMTSIIIKTNKELYLSLNSMLYII